MRKILGIARYTFIEIFRNRVYLVLLLFGGLLIGSTLLLGSLGGEQRGRMMIDLGLGGIEMFALMIAVFSAVTLVLEEMESRTLYLVLTRPVARYQFILGRFLGLMTLVSAAFVLMAAAHLLLLRVVHINVESAYFPNLFFSWEKILLITGVAMVFSLFSTSTVSAIVFTLFFWVMGHLSGEIRYLAGRTPSPLLAWGCRLFYFLTPNFSALNRLDFAASQLTAGWAWSATAYALAYTAASLGLTMLLFRRREF